MEFLKFISVILLFTCISCNSKKKVSKYNLSFENLIISQIQPVGWETCSPTSSFEIDSLVKEDGKYSLHFINTKSNFSCASYTIPGNFKGTEIEATGYLKLNKVQKGFCGIALQVEDDKGQIVASEDMMESNLSGTKDWLLYSIKFLLPTSSKKIRIGAYLNGSGEIWIDNLNILIDGTPFSLNENDSTNISTISPDHTDDLRIDTLNNKIINDLARVGKVWGYLKYYHPMIQQGEFNWDNELFGILPKVISSSSTIAGNELILKWVQSFDPERMEKTNYSTVNKMTNLYPDLKWINDSSQFSKDLVSQLNLIENYKRRKTSHYVRLIQGVGNPEFTNELAYSESDYPNMNQRLICLFRYWNIIQYYYPYRYLIKDWTKTLNDFIPKFINAKDALEYRMVILELVQHIEDSHATVDEDNVLKKFFGEKMIPVDLAFIENKVVVKEVIHYRLRKYNITSGDIVEKIGGLNIDSILNFQKKYCSGSNEKSKIRDILPKLVRTNSDSITITLRKSGVLRSIIVPTVPISQDFTRVRKLSQTTYPNDIYYLLPKEMKKEMLDKELKRAKLSRAMIIDMRCYPSDFIIDAFAKNLISTPTKFYKISYPSIEQPGRFQFTEPLMIGLKNGDSLKTRVAILINETTQSQSEFITMALKVIPNAIIVGSNSAGADGNVSSIILPGNVQTRISGIGIYFPDGSETQKIGLVPNIYVYPTMKGIMKGKDEVLERAIIELNKVE